MKKSVIVLGLIYLGVLSSCVNTAPNGAPTNAYVDTTSMRTLSAQKEKLSGGNDTLVPQATGEPAQTQSDSGNVAGGDGHETHGHGH